MWAAGVAVAATATTNVLLLALLGAVVLLTVSVHQPEGARGFEALGITPTPMEAILTGYLYVYRPGGQYAAIKDSATQLRA